MQIQVEFIHGSLSSFPGRWLTYFKLSGHCITTCEQDMFSISRTKNSRDIFCRCDGRPGRRQNRMGEKGRLENNILSGSNS